MTDAALFFITITGMAILGCLTLVLLEYFIRRQLREVKKKQETLPEIEMGRLCFGEPCEPWFRVKVKEDACIRCVNADCNGNPRMKTVTCLECTRVPITTLSYDNYKKLPPVLYRKRYEKKQHPKANGATGQAFD